jgi:hypothetical protein
MTTAAEVPQKRRWRPSLAQVGTTIGVISGIVTLVFIFKPDWRPIGSPDVGKLTISGVKVKTHITFRRYLQRVGSSEGTMAKAYLRQQGVLAEFRFDATGFRGKRLPIHWELVNAKTNEAVADDESVGITPSTNDEARQWFVWAPLPKTRKTYYLTITIYQPQKQRVPLHDFDTKSFKGLATP